jgi:hypothetical protein
MSTKEEYAHSQASYNGKKQTNIECHGDQHESIGYSGLDKREYKSHKIDLRVLPSKVAYRNEKKKSNETMIYTP